MRARARVYVCVSEDVTTSAIFCHCVRTRARMCVCVSEDVITSTIFCHGTMPCSPLISDRGFPCGLPSNEILLKASIFIAVVRTPGMEGPKDSQVDACGSSLCHCFHCLVP